MNVTNDRTVFDVAVIGSGPAGAQAAVSAAHQMRHVVLIDGGSVSLRRGRHFWTKSVDIVDAPVFQAITGPALRRALLQWLTAQPVRTVQLGDNARRVGIHRLPAYVTDLQRATNESFNLTVSTAFRPEGDEALSTDTLMARTIVVATGFEDNWPAIEIDSSAQRAYERYRVLFRYAGNHRGWHVCIRCDGHLHVDQELAIVGVGDYIFDVVHGAQDFTSHMTVLTNGRPHGMSDTVLAEMNRRGIGRETERISAHIGTGRDLLGLQLADGRQLHFDGFFVDEGLRANDRFLDRFAPMHNGEGLLECNENQQVIDSSGRAIAGIWAGGDIVAGQRNLIAAAFASGQNAGLAASDSLRKWPELTRTTLE